MLNLSVIRQPDFVIAETEEKVSTLIQGKDCYRENDIQVICQETEDRLVVSVQAESSRLRFLMLRWLMPIPSGVRILGDAFERGYGDFEWRGIVPERYLPWYFLITDNNVTAGCGVKTAPAALCNWQIDSDGITLCLDVRCGDTGVGLQGRKLTAAEIVMESPTEAAPYSVARQLCRKMCNGAILPSAPVYGSNNWYYAYGNSSHENIVRDAELLASLSPINENRPYMVVDDGWQQAYTPGGSNNGGPWLRGNKQFPDMPKLADEIHSIGVLPGLWFRPLLYKQRDIPESWRLAHNPDCLDISNGEVLRHISEDVRRFNQWGFKLIKYDFTTYDVFGRWGFELSPRSRTNGWHFADTGRTSAEIIWSLYETIYQACTPDTIILGCNCIGHLGVGTMHVFRTGDDTSGRSWERTRKMGINSLAFRLAQHNIFYAVDADCVGMTGNIPWELNKRWLHLLQNSGTPLFVSVDPDTINEEQRSDLMHAFQQAAVQTDSLEPVDWVHNTCPAQWKVNGVSTQYHWVEDTGVSIME